MKGSFIIMKQKHLTLEDILKNNFNLTEIEKTIGKNRTTISKEILNHRFEKESIQYGTTFANCTNPVHWLQVM